MIIHFHSALWLYTFTHSANNSNTPGEKARSSEAGVQNYTAARMSVKTSNFNHTTN